ncbi:hypothetical protein PINS_up024198 [Pythium insidiosum]|nr:hypothetical protein PINS_up024198 [Pythium insidiosum]
MFAPRSIFVLAALAISTAAAAPMQKTSGSSSQVLGCEHRVLGGDYTEGAKAWQVDMSKVELPANSRLVIKAVQADQKDDHPAWAAMTGRPMSDGKSLTTAHTVVASERCSWSFVVSAPGFRVDYEPPANCQSSDAKQSSTAYSASVLPNAEAGRPSMCASPVGASQAPSSTQAPSPTQAWASSAASGSSDSNSTAANASSSVTTTPSATVPAPGATPSSGAPTTMSHALSAAVVLAVGASSALLMN